LQTTTKKKITSAFSFPAQLDMRHRLSELSQFDLVYDLSAVLIHKGGGVNSGHYIAHIKDKNTGQWWEFDDEHVTNLGNHPFGEGPSSSTIKSIATDAIQSEVRIAESNGNKTHSQSSPMEIFSSCDAYMLMYHLKPAKNISENGGIVCGANHKEIEGVVATARDGTSLPSHLYDEIHNFNA
jgi:ubiquitin carboxyl-terminal hydrolase 48